jgi:hypothetical protein
LDLNPPWQWSFKELVHDCLLAYPKEKAPIVLFPCLSRGHPKQESLLIVVLQIKLPEKDNVAISHKIIL